jgi:hypothetical protein
VRNIPNDLPVDGTRDAVLQLEVHLGNGVFWEYGCVRDITYKASALYFIKLRASKEHKRIAADSTMLRILYTESEPYLKVVRVKLT